MPRLILLLAVVITLVILVRRAQQQPPHKRRGAYLKIILGGAIIGILILTLMGKMHWLGAAITGVLVLLRQALPLVVRLLPALGNLRAQAANAGSKQSEVSARIIKMCLDHDTGELSGEVLEGTFKDWRLEELDREQLNEIMDYCQREDNDSAQLLASYLDQRFPDNERESGSQQQDTRQSSGGLTRGEALAVLGLRDGATNDEIITAHRSLIQKLHPDRGGNDYLAAKINEAKDFLLD